jgi:hypothetical protein
MEGSHWIGIFANGLERDIFYYDSLAIPINPLINETFLKLFPKIIKNSHPYQSPLSNSCGEHCICFIYFLSIGYTFDQFLKLLNTKENPDLFVKLFVKKLLE